MDEIFKSIKAFLYDRAASPLLGAYISAWSIWNYRVFVALFDGDSAYPEKMAFLDAYFGPISLQFNNQIIFFWGAPVHGLLCPAALTYLYLYGYPKLAKPVYEHSLAKQIELRKIKQREEEARLLSPEESRRLTKEIEQLRLKADADAEQYGARVSSLTETINELETKLHEAQQKVSEEPLNETWKTDFDSEDLYELVESKLGKLKEGEFKLSELFDEHDWEKLGAHKRYLSELYFAELVDSGKYPDVFISRRGDSNQIMYQKRPAKIADLSAIKKELERHLTSGADGNEIVDKVTQYCIANELSDAMIAILFELVLRDGSQHMDVISSKLRDKLSRIELEHMLKKLRERKLVDVNGVNVALSSAGKEMAVNSGLTSLAKITKY